MQRRGFVTSLVTAAIAPVVLRRRALTQQLPARVDATALRQRIEALTSWDDCARGAEVLLGTVLEMDRV